MAEAKETEESTKGSIPEVEEDLVLMETTPSRKKRKHDAAGSDGDAATRDTSKRLSGDTFLGQNEIRKVPVPPHRYTPLKDSWMKIFTPVVDHLHLQIRFNLNTRNVELRSSAKTKDIGAIQKGADFVRAFMLGFDVEDALALVRLDDLFLDSFDIEDVKPLKGDHLSRAIGRIAGKGGKTKFTIENVTKTRITLADSKIHILGSYQNIQMARRSVCNLIMGSAPSKVYGSMRAMASRSAERF
ncbi:RNA-binding protein PNO1-like [Sycon ciliatum]|uniref:RNA-binding protein PNO1-like n=1 Tax=Sycon ciliatum TaxID=27933 RepID=UPI0020ABE1EE|eukprot:scpid98769/ scgid18313/ RNA-binding protein pno1